MKLLVIAVLVFAALAQARDLSIYHPKGLQVWPERLPEGIINPMIVNGKEADLHQFPYQCALFIDGRSFCGCSVLDENTILTAAHCADGARSIEVVAGAHNIQQNEESQQSIISKKFIVHEDWDPNNIRSDVALIALPQPLNIDGETVALVALYSGDSDLVNEQATVSGWGRPSDSSGTISPVLRFATDKILSNSKCKIYFNIIENSHICLTGANRRSSCNGDSGGPLVFNNNGKIEQVGIVSFGSAWGCGIGFPSAYSRVSYFHSWITAKRASL